MHKYNVVRSSALFLNIPQRQLLLLVRPQTFSTEAMTRKADKRPEWIGEDNVFTSARTEDAKVQLPGYGLSVNAMAKYRDWSKRLFNRCPNALQEWAPEPITVREKTMMQVINSITDKPEWRRKVFDDVIVEKWRLEVVTEEGQGFTNKMFDYCIAELRDKAVQHKENDLIAVLDSKCAVVKSDSIISSEMKEELKNAVAPLENVSETDKDWHPGSNQQVLDLVHPSLFPLIYGRSRILSTGLVSLDDCVQTCGKGEIVPVPSEDECELGRKPAWLSQSGEGTTKFWSSRFQWLPCDVTFAEGNDVKIASYINNLHPVRHKALYPVIEKFIAKSISAWELVLSSYFWNMPTRALRVPMTGTEYEFPLGEGCPDHVSLEHGEDSDEYFEARENWVRDNRVLVKPDARDYDPSLLNGKVQDLDFRNRFSKSGLQVIVKLANIHLNPSQPRYEGGSWHIEGQLNEHICATALYYYDNDNITDSHLAFRQKVSTEDLPERDYGQDDNDGVCYLFDIERNSPGIQTIGKVATNEGRLLAFPNVLQHQVQPFELADHTRPGHRKILALFLIDPFQRVISTANVPPQQREWWGEALHNDAEGRIGSLPAELKQQILDGVEDFPISLEEAKKLREELMAERRVFVTDVNDMYDDEDFSFCEH